MHQVAPSGNPAPAFVLSMAVHVALVLSVPWAGQAVSAPPSPGPTPFQFVDVSDIAMPGTGSDPLSGPAGVAGGGPFGVAGGPPAPEGMDPMAVIPRSAVEWLEAYEASDPKTQVPPPSEWHEHTPSVPGLQAPEPVEAPVEAAAEPVASGSGVPVVGGIQGVPVAGPLAPRSSERLRPPARDEAGSDIVDDGASAIRAAMLRALLEGGAEVVDASIGLGSPSGEGGMGPFSGAGSRYGVTPDPELMLWQVLVRKQLMERFKPLPVIVKNNPGLSVTVAILLGPQGAVLDREVRESSGNASFDAAAIWAVDAGPLAPPPEAWAEVLKMQGLAVQFSPGGGAALAAPR